jgi:hypothetical protein
MNVAPKNYSWPEFYDRLVDLTRYSFSGRAILRRVGGTATMIPKWMNLMRAVSSEGWGRIRYYSAMRGLLDTDRTVREFFEGESDELPDFYVGRVRRELGPLYDFLPPGALMHDPTAYLKAQAVEAPLTALSARSSH